MQGGECVASYHGLKAVCQIHNLRGTQLKAVLTDAGLGDEVILEARTSETESYACTNKVKLQVRLFKHDDAYLLVLHKDNFLVLPRTPQLRPDHSANASTCTRSMPRT